MFTLLLITICTVLPIFLLFFYIIKLNKKDRDRIDRQINHLREIGRLISIDDFESKLKQAQIDKVCIINVKGRNWVWCILTSDNLVPINGDLFDVYSDPDGLLVHPWPSKRNIRKLCDLYSCSIEYTAALVHYA